MNLRLILICLFSSLNCFAQKDSLIINQTLISDFSKSPFYFKLIEKNGIETVWKKAYKYIDSVEIYSLSYSSDGLKISGYIAKPKSIKGKLPCIIYNRGGSTHYAELTNLRAAVFLGEIAQKGYIVIASNYRGSSGSDGKDEFGGNDINDVLVLTEVLKEIEEADIQKIGMYGWSRGGMMTYLALTKTNKIKTAIVGGAISDTFKLIKNRPEMETEVFSSLIPYYHKNKDEELRKRSSVNWVKNFPKNVPILLLHGNSDKRVKSEQSLKMALEFEKHRIPYRLIIFEGGNHAITEHKKEVSEQIFEWFDKFLKNDEDLPNMTYH